MIRVMKGKVVSDKPAKTIVVLVQTHKHHPLYKKRYWRSQRYLVHDERDQAKLGDRVTIVESRPLSRAQALESAKRGDLPMIAQESRLTVCDNSGAKQILCIRVLGGTRRRYARVGDTIIATVKQASTTGQIKKKQVVRAVVVRTRRPLQRRDGSTIVFSDNAAVIIDEKRDLRATRVFGPVPHELRERGYGKIVSLAPEVL